jgi:hypothetical protein
MRHARFLFVLASSLSLGLLAASCTSTGPAGVFAYSEWRLRCPVPADGCSSYPDRCVEGFSGQNACGDNARIQCSVIQGADARTLSFSLSAGSYAIEMTNASFPRSGGSPSSGGCQMRVIEDRTTFTGACGSGPPREGQPCEVSGVSFGRDPDGRALISGNVYCQGMSPAAAPTLFRGLSGPGNLPADATSPMRFDLYDCTGFQPD